MSWADTPGEDRDDMHRELLTEWAMFRAENMMSLPSANSREWLEEFAEWLDSRAAQPGAQADGAKVDPITRDWSGEKEDKAWEYLQNCPTCGKPHNTTTE